MKFQYPTLLTHSVKGLRFYETPTGGYYPSITTILGGTMPPEKKAALENWRTSLGHAKADAYTKDACDSGTNVHTMIERYFRGEELVRPSDNFKPRDLTRFNAIKMKLKRINEIWGQEVSLYSDDLEVAGKLDCVGVYNGEDAIIDYKTSAKLKNDDRVTDHKLQMTAYSIMHNELFGTNIRRGIILMSSLEGFPQEFVVELDKYYEPLATRIGEFYDKLGDLIK